MFYYVSQILHGHMFTEICCLVEIQLLTGLSFCYLLNLATLRKSEGTVSLLSHLCFQAFGDRISTDHHECPSLTLNAYYQTVREVSS